MSHSSAFVRAPLIPNLNNFHPITMDNPLAYFPHRALFAALAPLERAPQHPISELRCQ
jgi:hypothetical protein